MRAMTSTGCSPPTTWSPPTSCSSRPPGSPTGNSPTACGTGVITRPLTPWSCAPAPGPSGGSAASTSCGSCGRTRRSTSAEAWRVLAAAEQAETAALRRRAHDDLTAEDQALDLDDRGVGTGQRRAAAPPAQHQAAAHDDGHPGGHE